MTARFPVPVPLTLALLLGPLAAAQTAPAQPAPAQTAPAQTTPTQSAPVSPAPAAPVQTPAIQTPAVQTPATQTPATQTPVPATQVSLREALGQLTQAPGWKSAALQYLSAQQNLNAARARAGLSLSVGADLNAVKAPIDGDWTSGTTLNAQAGANVLPWSSAQGSVLLATRSLERAGLDQRDGQNALALSVVQGYFSAQQARASLNLAAQQQGLAQRQLEVSRAQQGAGVLTQETLLSAQASAEQAAVAVQDAGSTFANALRQLYNTLGTDRLGAAPQGQSTVPQSENTVPQGQNAADLNLVSRPAVPAAPAPLDTLLARAAQGRSEILKALSNQSDAQTALEAAKLDRALPDLSLKVQYGQLASGTGTAGSSLGSSLNFKTGQLSASVSLPLNQSGTPPPTSLALGLSGSYTILNPVADAAVQSAQTSLTLAALSLSSARSSVDLDVRQKYAQLQSALIGLAAPRTLLVRAQTALSSAQARVQAGLATALDAQQAELNVLQARNTLDSAVNAAYLASLSLSVAVAEFSPALIAVSDLQSPVAGQADASRRQDAQPNAVQPLPDPSASTGGQP